jgi:DNA-binding transcriptional LysR family regulator
VYTLHQLTVFLKVAELKSMTKAAEAMQLTQPGVSLLLKQLQEEVGAPLVDVVQKRVYLTSFGVDFQATAYRILEEARGFAERTSERKGLLAGTLRMGVVSTGKYIAPYLLAEFLRLHPGLELELDVTNRAKVLEDVAANRVDLALISVLPEKMALESLPLMENELVCVAQRPLAQPLPMDGVYPLGILEDYPILFREEGSATRMAMERLLAAHGIRPKKRMVLSTNEAVKQAVMAGLGLSIVPRIGMQGALQNGRAVEVPLRGLPLRSTWHIVWVAGKTLSPAAQAFVNALKSDGPRWIQNNFG